MNRTGVVSSNLASIGYDAVNKILEVEFLDGSIYQYQNVPLSVYNELMKAASHGKYFYANVRKAGYPYKQIR